ncbi:hypothetical protein BOTBODRAFT_186158 [Botryobasidium botryosum FD-172 SS1]|uniref:Uncharacterized protein n=1 Tax=Botryobasidium botryosum (strain FD-172 SS1) TaxID=930990 RepID=A0A067MMH9_BOTB1|nr:hypothetical protein BOTBODRAFT_186158 [Botryobasidium botryosum FD-172 SS1]
MVVIDGSLTPRETEAKSLLNRSRSIHRLPNEVLAMVFKFAMPNGSYSYRTHENRPPFNVMLVSTLWRDIVMSTPALWGHIDIRNRSLIETFLLRSRQAALDIDFAGYKSEFRPAPPFNVDQQVVTTDQKTFSNFIEPLLPHLGRWRSLVTRNVAATELHLCLLSPAPNLKCFMMRSRRCNHEDEAPPYNGIPLFAGHTPRLRKLRLNGAYFPLRYSIYTGLTSLELSAIHYAEPVQHPLQNIEQ